MPPATQGLEAESPDYTRPPEEVLDDLLWRPPAVQGRGCLLHEQICRFATLAEPDRAESKLRSKALSRVAAALRSEYPASELVLHGSAATGLALPTSDIDLVLCVGGNTGRKRAVDTLKRARRGLQVAKVVRRAELVHRAKVPVLKFTERQSDLAFDLCANEPGAHAYTAFMRSELERMPALRPLLLVLKCCLAQQGLNETFTGGVGSFMLFLMVRSALELDGAHARGAPSEAELRCTEGLSLHRLPLTGDHNHLRTTRLPAVEYRRRPVQSAAWALERVPLCTTNDVDAVGVIVAQKRHLQTIITAIRERRWHQHFHPHPLAVGPPEEEGVLHGSRNLTAVAVGPECAASLNAYCGGAAAGAAPGGVPPELPGALVSLLESGGARWVSGFRVVPPKRRREDGGGAPQEGPSAALPAETPAAAGDGGGAQRDSAPNAAPPIDLGRSMLDVLAAFAHDPMGRVVRSVSVRDPLTGNDVGAKAYRFADVSRVFARARRRLLSRSGLPHPQGCLSALASGWPAGGHASTRAEIRMLCMPAFTLRRPSGSPMRLREKPRATKGAERGREPRRRRRPKGKAERHGSGRINELASGS